MPVEHASTIDKLLDYVPDFMEKANAIANKTIDDRKSKNKVETNNQNIDKNEEKKDNVKIRKPYTPKKQNESQKNIEIEYDETNPEQEYLEDE